MLPAERGAQLHALAKHHGVTVVDLVERWILDDLEAAGLPVTLPGLEVKPMADDRDAFVHLDAEGLPIVHATANEARRLASLFDGIAASGGKGEIATSPGDVVGVARVGRGMALTVRCGTSGNSGKRTITPGIARDLARQLRTAAEAIENARA
jgi:hypothetical protein